MAVARSVAAGGLGSSAKVSTVAPGDEGRHVLCVYVDNYLDRCTPLMGDQCHPRELGAEPERSCCR